MFKWECYFVFLISDERVDYHIFGAREYEDMLKNFSEFEINYLVLGIDMGQGLNIYVGCLL